jgi:16S rRNA (cytosine967-C5)-methyltransferase
LRDFNREWGLKIFHFQCPMFGFRVITFKPSTAREIALAILYQVEVKKAYADLALDAELRRSSLSPEDRALVTELVYGVLRWQKTLDWQLEQVCTKPLKKTTPWIRNILRLGAYQLLFLTRVPGFAALNESVQLAKKVGYPGSHNFVNAVLRALDRKRDQLSFPELEENPVEHIALKYSHPEWLVKRWICRYGRDRTIRWCQANNQPPDLAIRINPLKTNPVALREELEKEAVTVRPLPFDLPGFTLKDHPPLATLSAYLQGWFTVQDPGSMLITRILDPQPHETILDACAGLGTKTTQMAEQMRDTGKILAVDLNASKIKLLQENCRRLGITSVTSRIGDITQLKDLGEPSFHRILVDAPCSGCGVFRRHPESKWRVTEEQIRRLQTLQLSLLNAVVPFLGSQGILVYSTCTTEPEENEEVIEKFFQIHTEFQVEPVKEYLPKSLTPLVTEGPYLKTYLYPEVFNGFFCVRLRKR